MATRKDIAQKAGVSISVVSRALNNSGYVNAEKKKKILEIARQLGYHPNPVAMSLSSQRTKQILFYCQELENAFNIEMYEGMLEAAYKQGYMVGIHGKLDFGSLKNTMVDGLILPNERVAEWYLENIGKNYHLPVVTASYGDPSFFTKSIPTIESDLWKGTRKVLQYLWDRGHRKIAIVISYGMKGKNVRFLAWYEFMKQKLGDGDKIGQYYFDTDSNDWPNDERVTALLEQKNIESIYIQETFFERGMRGAKIFAERNSDATAVMCFNDELALGFYKGLRELGYKIPEDISLIGIDGVYSRRYTDMTLTSLGINPRLQGQKCVEVLLNIINGKKFKYVTHIPMKILEGDMVLDLRGSGSSK